MSTTQHVCHFVITKSNKNIWAMISYFAIEVLKQCTFSKGKGEGREGENALILLLHHKNNQNLSHSSGSYPRWNVSSNISLFGMFNLFTSAHSVPGKNFKWNVTINTSLLEILSFIMYAYIIFLKKQKTSSG